MIHRVVEANRTENASSMNIIHVLLPKAGRTRYEHVHKPHPKALKFNKVKEDNAL